MTDLEKMIGNEVKELKTLYDMSEAEYDRRSEEGENITLKNQKQSMCRVHRQRNCCSSSG